MEKYLYLNSKSNDCITFMVFESTKETEDLFPIRSIPNQ